MWWPAFFTALRNSGNIRASALAAGVERKTVYKAREHSPKFRALFDEAMEDALDILEAAARSRALSISDTLLIFLLKAHSEKYRFAETLRAVHSGSIELRPVETVALQNNVDTVAEVVNALLESGAYRLQDGKLVPVLVVDGTVSTTALPDGEP